MNAGDYVSFSPLPDDVPSADQLEAEKRAIVERIRCGTEVLEPVRDDLSSRAAIAAQVAAAHVAIFTAQNEILAGIARIVREEFAKFLDAIVADVVRKRERELAIIRRRQRWARSFRRGARFPGSG